MEAKLPCRERMEYWAASVTLSSRGLGHRPFTAVTRVRIPLGSPDSSAMRHRLNSRQDNLAASVIQLSQNRPPGPRFAQWPPDGSPGPGARLRPFFRALPDWPEDASSPDAVRWPS